MRTIQDVLSMFPSTVEGDWKQNPSGGWVHSDAQVKGGLAIGAYCVIRGGTIWGGTIEGGTIYGGTWQRQPLFIQGSSYPLTHAAPHKVAIGCTVKTIASWRKTGLALAKEHNFTEFQIAEYSAYLDLMEMHDKELFPVETSEVPIGS